MHIKTPIIDSIILIDSIYKEYMPIDKYIEKLSHNNIGITYYDILIYSSIYGYTKIIEYIIEMNYYNYDIINLIISLCIKNNHLDIFILLINKYDFLLDNIDMLLNIAISFECHTIKNYIIQNSII